MSSADRVRVRRIGPDEADTLLSVVRPAFEARPPVVFHAVRMLSAAKDFESLTAQQLVFIHAVIEVPNPEGIPQSFAACQKT